MTDKEMTFLAFLAEYLVAHPKEYQKGLDMAWQREELSDEYGDILDAISAAFEWYEPSTLDEVVSMANKLYNSPRKAKYRAGHILRWGFPEDLLSEDE